MFIQNLNGIFIVTILQVMLIHQVILALTVLTAASLGQRIVHTLTGAVRGTGRITMRVYVHQFLRIPYAEPPIGELRFNKTRPVVPWNGVYDATKYGPSCVQRIKKEFAFILPNTHISEDCLQLNIYVSDVQTLSKPLKPVMIWIHGGGFYLGSGTLYDGSYLAATGDVIVVTVNYRLGMLGFIHHDNLRGNYGLWDQLEAIRWVKYNIEFFGGDPNLITLFGESAGASSVALMATMTKNRGLFKRIILQSGGYNNPFTFDVNMEAGTTRYLEIIGCRNATQQCLLSKSANEINNAQDTWLAGNTKADFDPDTVHISPTLGPTVDGELIIQQPSIAIRNESSEEAKFFKSLDVIAGVTTAEGYYVVYQLEAFGKKLGFDYTKGCPSSVLTDYIVPRIEHNEFYNASNGDITKLIINKYRSEDQEEQARKLVDLQGDIYFYQHLQTLLRFHATRNLDARTYQYMFDEPSPVSMVTRPPSWFRGAAHADDVGFLFGIQKALLFGAKAKHLRLSEKMMKYWSNFARTG